MGLVDACRRHCRAPALIFCSAFVLLLVPGAARAVDGVPLYPPGIDAAYSMTSMEHPDLSGPALTFEIFGLSGSPVVRSQTARVMFWNAATGVNRNIGNEVPGLPAGADQRHPAVIDRNGHVYIVWQQWDDPVTATRDIWLWRGDERGNADPGFPMLLISGPAHSNQYAPDIGLSKTPSGNHLIVTWADDRDTSGASTQIYLLDLTADTDGDSSPNYLEPGFDPAYGGDRVDPSGDLLKGQHDPAVGAKGIFWLDERDAEAAGNADVYRADLAVATPAVSRFWTNPTANEAISPRATGEGAAWLGPGIAGGPFEPWVVKPGGDAGIITSLGNPQAFDVSGMRFAITGGHNGDTGSDWDIFFYDKAAAQSIPVCSVGVDNGFDRLRIQDMPTIGSAPGGSRVVWCDTRQHTNTAATDIDALAHELYVALVPTVTQTASRTTLKLGKTLKLSARVTPGFKGYKVKFQAGTRQVFKHTWFLGGSEIQYGAWKTLKTMKLSKTSKASWTWKPTGKGTYWVRTWFAGGKKYVDVRSAHRKVPHVPNASKVVRIVVK